jgi:hypothetical protein
LLSDPNLAEQQQVDVPDLRWLQMTRIAADPHGA